VNTGSGSAGARILDRWWAAQSLAENSIGHWQIGPLALWIQRFAQEWRLAVDHGGDPLDSVMVREMPSARPFPEDHPEARRFGFRKTSDKLKLMPVLADRPVVINPAIPFALPPGEELTLYLSTAVWLQVLVGEPAVTLLEVPTHRPSDTWFGPSTREGEMCYAVKTSARQQLENLPLRPHRVISALRIRNRARTNLAVERIKLPVPHMSIFEAAAGQLWTESVTLEREEDGEMARLQLGKKPPAAIEKTRLLSGPRVKPDKALLIRAFGGLIGGFW